MNATGRVAVVVVHGIADQRPGQTVRELVRLLCHGGEGAPRFVQGEMHDVLVPVAKLEPGGAPALTQSPEQHAGSDARTPESSRRRPGTPSGFYQVQQSASAETAATGAKSHATTAAAEKSQDLGIALNDYLLGRLTLSEGDALYESTRVSLRRRADDRAVDVYELYWADLSRLRTGGVRALSAMYQLFFHLSTLAADVVDQISLSAGASAAWRTLQRLHAWSAWLMKAPAAIVQLSMLLLVVFGATAFVPPEQQGQLLFAMFGVGALALAALAALAWLHGTSMLTRWVKLLLLLTAAVASLAAAIVALRAEGWIAMIYFGASALASALLGTFLIERYARVTHGVRVLGHVLVAATVIMLCVEAQRLLPSVTTQREWMLTAALHIGEWLLAAMLLVWAVFVVVQTAALLLGLWLGRADDGRVRASLHTSRLTLVVSTALFAVLSLVLWSVVGYVAGLALKDLYYEPAVFGSGYRSAAIFLEDRVQSLGGFFTPLVLAFTLLAAAGKWLAGGALTITALGARFTQTFGRLRVALDAVLDIDNYFGDPPNRQPPRARIYSRFASLLAYVRDGGYTRIVIVSHSQGTVISADLLRYLHVQRRLPDIVGAIPIALVTVGSPLRDLYAEHFPLLYEWMGSNQAGFTTAAPTASDLGATEWVNACRSGDYVGRFIWTPPSDAARFRIAVVGPDGKVEAQRAGDRTEFCLGAGGHTHYFSNDAVALAVEIDRLIAA